MQKEVKQIGNIYGFDGGNYAGNVYEKDGLCPVIRANSGGNTQPMIIVPDPAGVLRMFIKTNNMRAA